MKHPYEVLRLEYEALMARATVLPKREAELRQVCVKTLLPKKSLYIEIQRLTDVPAAWLMAIAMREMSGNTTKYLGNGQSLSMRTTIVPIGRGPFTGSRAFINGALDALDLDDIDKVKDWTMARAAYQAEAWNGWGYRGKIPSPYVWGATTVQKPGKYIRDHVYDSSVMDQQLGVIALIEELISLDPSLQFADTLPKVADAPSIVPQTAPLGVGGELNVFILQTKLNALKVAGTPLKVDGVYGRATTRAVKAYQFTHHLDVDGLVGPKTLASMKL